VAAASSRLVGLVALNDITVAELICAAPDKMMIATAFRQSICLPVKQDLLSKVFFIIGV
jgi:hypothetical protein